jgi:Xaa-Pro aminopeptidase
MEVPVYSLAERDRRWALARKLMAAEGVDALIAHSGHECGVPGGFAPDAYFSNDLPGSVVIFCRDADPVLLVRPNPPAQARMWIGPAGIRVGADAAGIAEVLCQQGLEQAPVGVLGPGITLAGAPRVRLKPVDRSFLLATACPSEEELAVVRYCAAAGEAAARAMVAAAAPGVTGAEVCAAGTAAAVRLGCMASTLMWSGRAPRVGDVLLAEVTTRFCMKETRHPVAIAIGNPHPDIETAAVIARASYQAGLRAARVGSTFGDLAEAMLMPLKQAGSRNTRPLVRMLSTPGPPDGFACELDQLPLAQGMCCAFAPSAVIAGRAVSLGGTVVIGQDSPMELSPFTARMLRVPAGKPH